MGLQPTDLIRGHPRKAGAWIPGSSPRMTRTDGSARLRQVLCGEIPIDEVVEKRLHEIGPAVLEVEIVGVLPDVAGEERGLALGQRVDRVRRAADRQLAAAGDEPGPAAAELADRS